MSLRALVTLSGVEGRAIAVSQWFDFAHHDNAQCNVLHPNLVKRGIGQADKENSKINQNTTHFLPLSSMKFFTFQKLYNGIARYHGANKYYYLNIIGFITGPRA